MVGSHVPFYELLGNSKAACAWRCARCKANESYSPHAYKHGKSHSNPLTSVVFAGWSRVSPVASNIARPGESPIHSLTDCSVSTCSLKQPRKASRTKEYCLATYTATTPNSDHFHNIRCLTPAHPRAQRSENTEFTYYR